MAPSEPSRLDALRILQRLIARLNSTRQLTDTLQGVVDGVVTGLRFDVAVVSLVLDDSRLEVIAAAGRDDVRAALVGQVRSRADWDRELARADAWGPLRFVPHERCPDADDPLRGWVPDLAVHPDDPDAWHPLDALYAPLTAPTGELVGVLSVDLPVDGRRPGARLRELLEMYAAQAGIAIDNARLHERLRGEREALRESEQLFRLAFDNAPIGMALCDLRPGRTGRYLRVNDALCEMLGYTRAELLECTFRQITHPEDIDRDAAAIEGALSGALQTYRAEKRYLRKDGSLVWMAVQASVIRDADGTARRFVAQYLDISERKQTEMRLVRQALHDPLTGLPNRLLLLERLERAVTTARRHQRTGALLFCDLDDFKRVNDAFGHAAGDAALVTVADRLSEQVRAADTVARLGGDEFVVLLEDVTAERAVDLAARLGARICAPLRYGEHELSVTMSIGLVPVDATGLTAEELLHAADAAMYRAKRMGKNAYHLQLAGDPVD